MIVTEINDLRCPSWCTTDHAEQDRKNAKTLARVRERTGQLDYTPDWLARWHTRTVAEVPNPAAGESMKVQVTLYRDDTLASADPDRAVVSAEHADCMAPDTAVKVAAAILAAVEVARDQLAATGSSEDVDDGFEYTGPNIRRAAQR